VGEQTVLANKQLAMQLAGVLLVHRCYSDRKITCFCIWSGLRRVQGALNSKRLKLQLDLKANMLL